MRSIILSLLWAKCFETIDVYVLRILDCMAVVAVCLCCDVYSCTVHPVAVRNVAFYRICSLLVLVEDASGDHIY